MIGRKDRKISKDYGLKAAETLARFFLMAYFLIAGAGQVLAFEVTQQPAKPALRIAGKFTGADETEGIKITTPIAAFEREFLIESIETEVKGLRVSVTPLTAPDSTQIDVSWTVGEQDGKTAKPDVPATEAVSLKIKTSLPVDGAYTGSISLIYNNKRFSIPLTITRAHPAPTLEIPNLESVRDESMTTEGIPIRLTIRETAGQEVKLFLPQLEQPLLLIRSDKTKSQASFAKLIVQDETGKPLTEPLTIHPRETKSLRLLIDGISDSGEFTGNVIISGSDVSSLTRSVTIYRKRTWILAGVLIFLGVAASYLIRFYVKNARPQLVRQQRVAVVLSELEALARDAGSDLNDDEKKVFQMLRRRLSETYENFEALSEAQVETLITEVNRKLDIFPKWVTARRAVESLEPPALREPFQEKISAAKFFMEKTPLDEAKAKEIETALDQLPEEINKASEKDLTERLTAFRAEVEKKLTAADTSESTRLRLSNDVIPRIKEAQNLLQSSAPDYLKNARNLYNEGRFAYIRLSAENLIAGLPAAAPLGFDASTDSWDKLRAATIEKLEKVVQATAAAPAAAAYEDAYTFYLREITLSLRNFAGFLEHRIGNSNALKDDVKAKFNQEIEAAKPFIESALLKVSDKKLDEAAQDYDKAKEAIAKINDELQTIGGGTLAVASASQTFAAVESVTTEFYELPFWQSVFQRDKRTPPEPAQLARVLFWIDSGLTLFVLIVAVVLGLKLLWYENAVWGTAVDYIAAFFWGLGMHQVGGALFEGVPGLVAKIGK